MTTPLADVTYETVETLSLSVADMLSLLLALHDARNYNNDKKYYALAKAVYALERRIRPQIDALIGEADRKVSVAMGKPPTYRPASDHRAPLVDMAAALKEEPATVKHQLSVHPDDYRD